jgi:putative membrane protein
MTQSAPTSTEPPVLWDATFDPKVKTYYLWATPVIFCLTIVLIPVAIIYVIVGSFFVQRHIDNLGCTLTARTLEIKKGIWNKTESTIPLEKITDLQMFQGPIMRHFGLRGFKVETAGQSSGPGGSLVNIIGIVDAVEFRKRVLDQRDALASRQSSSGSSPTAAPPPSDTQTLAVLSEIRDTLTRIESTLSTPRHTDGS